ncbi:MAG: hypothetical protein C6W57_03120 [Caldibacillus debilis]|nr:MAG: hypothetical protein C6W57_03120 [Caldibacillus debilis]
MRKKRLTGSDGRACLWQPNRSFFRFGGADPSRRQYGHERGGRPEPEMGFPMTRIKIFPDDL